MYIVNVIITRMENLENENGHGKVIEYEKVAKMSWNYAPEFYQISALFADSKKFNIG